MKPFIVTISLVRSFVYSFKKGRKGIIVICRWCSSCDVRSKGPSFIVVDFNHTCFRTHIAIIFPAGNKQSRWDAHKVKILWQIFIIVLRRKKDFPPHPNLKRATMKFVIKWQWKRFFQLRDCQLKPAQWRAMWKGKKRGLLKRFRCNKNITINDK